MLHMPEVRTEIPVAELYEGVELAAAAEDDAGKPVA
jgi:hypothetical protein